MPRIATTTLAAATLCALASGCGVGTVTEDNYAEKAAEVSCEQYERCSRGFFDSEWDDVPDCIDDLTGDFEDQQDEADDFDCDFDEDEAQQCLDTLNAATCEEIYEGDAYDDCDKVFDC